MSLTKRSAPTTIKELKAALAAYRDSQAVMIYEDAELSKLPSANQLKAQKRTVRRMDHGAFMVGEFALQMPRTAHAVNVF